MNAPLETPATTARSGQVPCCPADQSMIAQERDGVGACLVGGRHAAAVRSAAPDAVRVRDREVRLLAGRGPLPYLLPGRLRVVAVQREQQRGGPPVVSSGIVGLLKDSLTGTLR
jgi:hypothetical protein